MPELPEVETVRQILIKTGIIDQTIQKVEVGNSKLIKETTEKEFIDLLLGQTIHKLERKGMTGKYFVEENLLTPEQKGSISLIFHLGNGKKIIYCDARRFGNFRLQNLSDYQQLKPYKNIGIDLLNEPVNINYLFTCYQKRKVPIKIALLEQDIISGIGNIYASEILFVTHIHPLRKTHELTYLEVEKIISAAQLILKEALKLGGTSAFDFINPLAQKGDYQTKLKVYARAKKPCYVCNTLIENKEINSRTNVENATHGKGISKKHYKELKFTEEKKILIDVMTSGNHIFAIEETKKHINEVPDLLRPLNFNPYHPGPGTILTKVKDFHAETTAEKIALALYFDGKISALWGTHTHVQTADERILLKGTAFITDLGMTGPSEGVIGAKPEAIFRRAKYGFPAKIEPHEDEKGEGQFNGVIFEFDDNSNKKTSFRKGYQGKILRVEGVENAKKCLQALQNCTITAFGGRFRGVSYDKNAKSIIKQAKRSLKAAIKRQVKGENINIRESAITPPSYYN
ncbi:8017_t:CDS:2 [Funneliformis geosporum]|nr:8017_t:CDS:2 [Funneliformis geosporum]